MTCMARSLSPGRGQPGTAFQLPGGGHHGPGQRLAGLPPEPVDRAADPEGGVQPAPRVEDGSADAAYAVLPLGRAGRPTPPADRLQLTLVDGREPAGGGTGPL